MYHPEMEKEIRREAWFAKYVYGAGAIVIIAVLALAGFGLVSFIK